MLQEDGRGRRKMKQHDASMQYDELRETAVDMREGNCN